jgi:hypothetical protein
MKQILGLILIILAIPMALYVAFWLCFIHGIIETINSIKTTPVDTLHMAYGLAKILCTGLAGWFTFACLLIPGIGFLLNDYKKVHLNLKKIRKL